MTDITELAQSLKAAAEKATPGPWITFDDDWSDDEDTVVTNEARDNDCVSPVAVIKGGGSESDDDSPYCAEQRANSAFISLANPANILALVEALEKAQQRITQLESRAVTVKLPTTRLWAGVTECYEKSDVIAAIRAAGVEVSDD
ncbi:hypothetical protein C0Q74_08780 [Klebsiella pneumoniae]|uniref:ead/Ea22-like family protein n=1 Tax=Klebsiella pneumoniae TaxID=573 RepID=UPI001C81FB73|nr:ead/Ea22-like family protein [Klebsiella pneumoniae]MBX4728632.1 hypothetical protein [Klebsiella pneumoniae]